MATLDRQRIQLGRALGDLLGQYGPEVFVTSITGDSVRIYPMPVWEELEARLLAYQSRDRAAIRYLERVNFYGSQSQLSPRNRLPVGELLRSSARLQGEVVVLGRMDHVEVFALPTLEERLRGDDFTSQDAARIHRAISPGSAAQYTIGALAPPDSDDFLGALTECNTALARYMAAKPERVRSLRPRVFEELVAEVLRSFGYEVELTAQSKDGGFDIIAVYKDALGIPIRYVVECKHYAPHRPITVELVRMLYGVQAIRGADRALFVTTSRFTRDAWRLVEGGQLRDMALVDYEKLVEWLQMYRSGSQRT